jgi:hypothetical protein
MYLLKKKLLLPDQCDPATQLQDGSTFANCSMSLVDSSSFASTYHNDSFYSGATDDSCNNSCTSQHDDTSDENNSFYSGAMDDSCDDSCTLQDENSDDQSFSTQGSNDTF